MPILIKTEVGGIQKFINNTGKLKEIIGASQIIYEISRGNINATQDKGYYTDILRNIGCARRIETKQDNKNALETEPAGSDWHIVVQSNAGAVMLILPDPEKGRAFLKAYSLKVLEEFPGLPLFGAQAEIKNWTVDAYMTARAEVEASITSQRMAFPAASGLPILPVTEVARLDSRPACKITTRNNVREALSILSVCKRDKELLAKADDRLRHLVKLPDGILSWASDQEQLSENGKHKLALIYMDGNSMGKMFSNRLEEAKSGGLAAVIENMRKLSRHIQESIEEAFSYAGEKIRDFILQYDPGCRIMPLRPLLMGGDDISVIARADIALAFIGLFTTRLTKTAKEKDAALNLTMGIGIVVMNDGYPYENASALAEELQESAKRLAKDKGAPQADSLDYLVLTEEVEKDLTALRKRVFTASDGASLTSKPFLLQDDCLSKLLATSHNILTRLPRSGIRPALTACRKGRNAAKTCWLNMAENLERRIGGRGNEESGLMSKAEFTELFEGNFFIKKGENDKTLAGLPPDAPERYYTRLGDLLELDRLMPADLLARQELLKLLAAKG